MLVGTAAGASGCVCCASTGHDLVLTHADDIAVGDAMAARAALCQRLHFVVNVNAVGADVLEVEVPLAKLHPRMVRGDVAQRIGQHPVIIGGTADSAAFHRERGAAAVSKRAPLITDDAQTKGHGSPTQNSSVRILTSRRFARAQASCGPRPDIYCRDQSSRHPPP